METADEIWVGDFFDRRREAEDLIGYLESVAGRPPIREDSKAHVLAVDTAYGHGKTFFLRRLDRHLKATEHVSAYVDAWVDDLEDQPIVALAATLDRALEPWIAQSQAVASGLADFKSKAGRVAKIVGGGLVKRGAAFLITHGAAEALSDELAKASEVARDHAKDALKDGGAGIVDDAEKALELTSNPSMDARISRFREGQAAIQAMRDSLAFVVNALADAGMKLPITIIVDELDRCRPTYAIKVLEEIKHLFDVQGVAFVLGVHGGQLEHSVTAAYGNGFDGSAYLRRFFNRRYSLKPVALIPLVEFLIEKLGINVQRLDHPPLYNLGSGMKVPNNQAALISSYITLYDLSARDAFAIVEALQTAMALIGGARVQLSYLLPLIISRHKGANELLMPSRAAPWIYIFHGGGFRVQEEPLEISFENFLRDIDKAAQQDDRELSRRINAGRDTAATIVVDYGFKNDSDNYSLLQNYRELVRAVARFT